MQPLSPPTLRMACEADVPAMLDIYAPAVRDTVVSFEYAPPSLLEFQQRFLRVTSRFPWIVAEADGQVVGYTYADAPFSRAAYQWSTDFAIYINAEARNSGLGKVLTRALMDMLTRLGYARLYAVVVASNRPCLRMLANLDFTQEACLVRSGYKFGSWHDVLWLGKELAHLSDTPAPPQPVSTLPAAQLAQCLHAASSAHTCIPCGNDPARRS